MKISRKSWHYRFLQSVYSEEAIRLGVFPPRDLCSYVWRLMFHLLIVLVIVAVLVATVAGIVVCFVRDWLASSVVTGFVAATFGIFVLGAWLVHRHRNGGPWIFLSWLKAKKEKVCPVVEYEN